jgi:hypothetical protein
MECKKWYQSKTVWINLLTLTGAHSEHYHAVA